MANPDKIDEVEGYVAFLDILGFRSVLAGKDFPTMFRRYCKYVNGPIHDVPIDGIPDMRKVMFSDSIVIATTGRDKFALRSLGETVAQIGYYLLTELYLPLRGCISYGKTHWMQHTVRTAPEPVIDVMVAGNTIVRAYEKEGQQDWVGVMLDPQIIATKLPELRDFTDTVRLNDKKGAELKEGLLWSGVFQTNLRLPFRQKAGAPNAALNCFAVVPHKSRRPSLATISEEIDTYASSLERCHWSADTPAIQQKYVETSTWLRDVSDRFERLKSERFYPERPDEIASDNP